MDCDVLFYETTYKRFFGRKRPADPYAKVAPPIPEKDPILIPGHFANNLTLKGDPRDTKTWLRPDTGVKPEEYEAFLEKLKTSNKPAYDRYFSDPKINLIPILDGIKDSKLSTYGSSYSPDYYVARKEDLKWRRLKLDTSMFKYQETHSNIYYTRVNEMPDLRKLAKPFDYQYDEELLKKDLRAINKTWPSRYYYDYCEHRIPELKALREAGKIWKDPVDKYTDRKVGWLVPKKGEKPA